MGFSTLKLIFDGPVAKVVLNRPEAANAMNGALWQELPDAFVAIDEIPEARVAVITGEGKHFTSGIDLQEFAAMQGAEFADDGRRRENLRRKILEMQESFNAIERCRVPVIAAVHGACIGAGIDMISACDMRFSTEDAFFSIHEINIGMAADVGTLQRLPHIIPAGVMRELAYTGRRVSGSEAAAIGLVNRAFASQEEMLAHLAELAGEIAGKSPLAVAGTKEMLTYARDHSVADGLNYVATWNAAMLLSDDLKNAVMAQMSKSEPEFPDLAPPPRFVRRRA
ncbi:MAG: crotonase/enoyl-CoA hydratase family protein [Sphingomonadales bacterium]|nr:crotonase/enoyl-CoA hydratase family protein [Sphingomonadales bacterium]